MRMTLRAGMGKRASDVRAPRKRVSVAEHEPRGKAVERAELDGAVEAMAALYAAAPEAAREAYRARQPVTAEVLEECLRARDVESLGRGES